jgi:hypothetical protein
MSRKIGNAELSILSRLTLGILLLQCVDTLLPGYARTDIECLFERLAEIISVFQRKQEGTELFFVSFKNCG